MKGKDTFFDWVEWFLYAFILALGFHSIRRMMFANLYSEMTSSQELFLFIVIVIGLAFFVVRPFIRSARRK